MALRQHDVVLAEGRFRIVLTDRHRLYAEIDAPQTALGPLHLAFEIDRTPHLRDLAQGHPISRDHVVGLALEDVGPSFSRTAGDVAFKTASNLAATVAPPAFAAVQDLARQGSRLLNAHLLMLPEEARGPLEAAARIAMRARLGDVPAKQFMIRIANARDGGAISARPVADALFAGERLVARALGSSGAIDAPHPFDQMANALQRGDFTSLQRLATSPPESADLTDGLDDYVRHFGASEVASDELVAPRLILPLARLSGGTSVGLNVQVTDGDVAPSGCGCRALVRRGEG